MDNKTKKLLAGFMIASMITMAGCSSETALSDDEEENEPGVVTSAWDNDTQQWNHYRQYRGQDYYFGSGTYPHESTVINPASPGVAKSTTPVTVQKMSAGGFTGGVRSSVSSARGGIGGGGGRASAAS